MKEQILLAGNWKMNKDIKGSLCFIEEFQEMAEKEDLFGKTGKKFEMAIFPQTVNLYALNQKILDLKLPILLGAQNIHWERSGALTGENSGSSVLEAGAKMALVGHSERRHIFGETDEMTARKYVSCVECGLRPVLCVGETEEEKSRGFTEKVLSRQLRSVFAPDRSSEEWGEIIIAYEPVWAIGTGKSATSEDAAGSCDFIRNLLKGICSEKESQNAMILYGGSVKSSNAAAFMENGSINGLLVGGASLDPFEFMGILRACGV
ncbi:MAG TPA: triose-phosphate isomerase [Thermovirgaceae bacterium]|jgi:triosephosphate isomerase|nr:triose-phosphate isomerase [Thermovirgaceae bacterium]